MIISNNIPLDMNRLPEQDKFRTDIDSVLFGFRAWEGEGREEEA